MIRVLSLDLHCDYDYTGCRINCGNMSTSKDEMLRESLCVALFMNFFFVVALFIFVYMISSFIFEYFEPLFPEMLSTKTKCEKELFVILCYELFSLLLPSFSLCILSAPLFLNILTPFPKYVVEPPISC